LARAKRRFGSRTAPAITWSHGRNTSDNGREGGQRARLRRANCCPEQLRQNADWQPNRAAVPVAPQVSQDKRRCGIGRALAPTVLISDSPGRLAHIWGDRDRATSGSKRAVGLLLSVGVGRTHSPVSTRADRLAGRSP
jgi:hypothetical protein